MPHHEFTEPRAPTYAALTTALADALDLLEERLPERHAKLRELQGVHAAAEGSLIGQRIEELKARNHG
jgi:hypothetical protein